MPSPFNSESFTRQVEVTDGYATYTIPYRNILYHKVAINPTNQLSTYVIVTLDGQKHSIPEESLYLDFVQKFNTWLDDTSGR